MVLESGCGEGPGLSDETLVAVCSIPAMALVGLGGGDTVGSSTAICPAVSNSEGSGNTGLGGGGIAEDTRCLEGCNGLVGFKGGGRLGIGGG